MWTFVYASPSFEPQGEILNMQERKVVLPLSKLDTCSFKVLGGNRFADDLLSCAGYIKAYRNGTLQFYGPIITAEEVGEGGKSTISVNAMSQGWVLGKHFPAKSVVTTALDRAVRFTDLLAAEDSKVIDNPYDGAPLGGVHAYTNIDVFAASAASTAIYSVAEAHSKSLATILGELSAGAGGFDWRLLPKENRVNGQTVWDVEPSIGPDGHGYNGQSYINSFYAAPTIGQLKEDVFFEYGDGKNNVVSYRRVNTREGQANVVYHRATGVTPEEVTGYDYDAIMEWGWLEDLAEADIQDATLRQTLVNDHVDIRKAPRRRIDFVPIGSFNSARVPQFGTDFDVGDIVRARAVGRFDSLFRVWGTTFDIDANGTEKMTLALAEEDS